MNTYAICDADGKIIRRVTCPAAMAELQVGVGEFLVGSEALAESFDDATHYVDTATQSITAKPVKPSEHHEFNYQAKTWIDPRTTEDVRQAKKKEITARRIQESRKTFTFAGKQVACDEQSLVDILGFNGIVCLLGDIPPNWIGYWKAEDNTHIAIPDKATWAAFFIAMVSQGQDYFVHAQNLKALADAPNATKEDIEAIIW